MKEKRIGEGEWDEGKEGDRNRLVSAHFCYETFRARERESEKATRMFQLERLIDSLRLDPWPKNGEKEIFELVQRS